ncbi:MAG: orotate phosphoribosyltransferase [Desulfobacca sp. 4484_104]|nr:MAG: orotate phosphoribosyltransferase [Desulfobacca sp. 4484_104]
MTDPSARQQLLKLLRQEALEFKDIILSSGRRSNYYIDCRRVTLSAVGAYLTAQLVLQHLPPRTVEAIGGLTLGADPIVAAVAAVSYQEGHPLQAFIVRKEAKGHGQQHLIEGPYLAQRARVAIIDDVATSGGSILKAIRAVQQQTDWQIARVMCLVDRQEGARELLAQEGYELSVLFTGAELTSLPD